MNSLLPRQKENFVSMRMLRKRQISLGVDLVSSETFKYFWSHACATIIQFYAAWRNRIKLFYWPSSCHGKLETVSHFVVFHHTTQKSVLDSVVACGEDCWVWLCVNLDLPVKEKEVGYNLFFFYVSMEKKLFCSYIRVFLCWTKGDYATFQNSQSLGL